MVLHNSLFSARHIIGKITGHSYEDICAPTFSSAGHDEHGRDHTRTSSSRSARIRVRGRKDAKGVELGHERAGARLAHSTVAIVSMERAVFNGRVFEGCESEAAFTPVKTGGGENSATPEEGYGYG